MGSDDDRRRGVMDAGYAAGRGGRPHLVWRYRARARVAADAYVERRGSTAAPRVLELGCADGRALLEIRKLLGGAGRYDGVDLSDALLAAAPPLPDDVRLLRGDAARLPAEIAPASYDLCAALAVLEHLPDPAAAVAEMRRALAPGGIAVATCPAPGWDRIAGRLGLVPGEHHERELDRAALERLFADAGFAGIEHRPFMWAPIAFLPYARIAPPVGWSLRADALVRRLGALGLGFVNQALIAVRPR